MATAGVPAGSEPAIVGEAVSSYHRLRDSAVRVEHGAVGLLRPLSLPAMRTVLGLVFVWFGALKVAGRSPVADLVAGTLPWAPRHVVVPVLGTAEMLLGLGVLAGVALRVVLPLLVAHLAGTFLTFLMLPGVMFRHHDPLLLTGDGEFVVKNLVLICATIVLITHAGTPET
ncbi:MAG: hypothetical protein J7518_17450 [Nocardioidaceae bacterium]|nr:hypothetical protein [Nocardioidaceae bacterium]